MAKDLGADQSTFGLVVAGVMIICVAPFAEEFFFRGFFYGALRTRFSVLVAALIDGLLFGAIHFEGGTDGLLIVPPLAVLGLHLLPGLRTHALALHGDRAALDQQLDRVRRSGGRRSGLGGAGTARGAGLRARPATTAAGPLADTMA